MKRMVIMVAALLVATAVGAREPDLPPGAWWDNPEVARRLELTDEQTARIRDLVYEHARRMIDLNAEVKRQELELAQRVDREPLEPAAVRQAFAAFQKARQRLELERFELMLAVRQELQPEQWDRLQRLREVHRRMEERQRSGDGPPDGRRPPRPGGRPGM